MSQANKPPAENNNPFYGRISENMAGVYPKGGSDVGRMGGEPAGIVNSFNFGMFQLI